MQYTVIGQAANLAARLEAYGKDDPAVANDLSGKPIDCRILVSEATKRLLAGDLPLTPMGTVALKGAQEPMVVYRLDNAAAMEKEPADA
jgi:class 3 adenylate cyclase